MGKQEDEENMYDIKEIDENIPYVGGMFVFPEVEDYGKNPMQDPILLPEPRLRAEQDYRAKLRIELRQKKRRERRIARKEKRRKSR